jgi:hypothetical protein
MQGNLRKSRRQAVHIAAKLIEHRDTPQDRRRLRSRRNATAAGSAVQ